MSEYILIIVWLALMALFQRFVETEETVFVEGQKKRRKTWWFAILVFFPLAWLAVNRDRYIGDTLSYIRGFEGMPTSLSGIISFYNNLGKDKWFYTAEALIHIFISKDYKICFLIIAVFQSFAVIKLYRKYSPNYIMAIFVFVACGDYVSWMHNGIRQFGAVSICVLATSWMLERKYIPTIITVLIASRFHGSALLMVPIFLISIGKPWNRRTMLFIMLAFVAIIYISQFTNLLDMALEETQYENVVSDWRAWNDDGTNPIRVLVYSIPAILSLMGLKYIQEADDPVINYCVNMSIITAGLYLISMFTSGIFIGRLPIYASLYSNGILLPWEIKHVFNRESSRLIQIAAITGYLLLYLYQLHFQWGII